MVLEDTPFRDMTHELMLKVTRPRVEGSIHLSELFPKDTLDFLVFFSSMTGVIGNAGQSNYSAANEFMGGLAAQRRHQGLAASVINIGPVLGVGYVAHVDQSKTELIFRKGHVAMSEYDFLQLFAEGVLTSRPASLGNFEISMGLRYINPDERYQPIWVSNPIFGNYVRNRKAVNTITGDRKSNTSAKAQLIQANNYEQVRNILEASIAPKIRSLFQLDADRFDQRESLKILRLDELGIDSLIAVDIRSWFMKTLDVNIPVLKILSGCSVDELINIAMEKLDPQLIPDVASGVVVSESPATEESLQSDPTSAPLSGASEFSSFDSEENESSSESLQLNSDSQEFPEPTVTKHILETEKTAELSFSQSMFWFVMAFLEDKTILNHTGCFRVTGSIRVSDLQNAVLAIGQRHEILRTRFSTNSGQPIQVIMASSILTLEHKRIKDAKEVPAITRDLERHVFDVERGDTMRFILLSLSPTINFFVIGIHHLVADGFSFPILMKDLLQFYNHQSPPRSLQYAEHSQRQHEDYWAGKYHNELLYWKNEFSDFPPPLPILRVSQAVSRPVSKVYTTQKVVLNINSTIKSQIHAICRSYKVTPFHFYLTAFRALLLRFGAADMDDIVIGIGDANRTEDNMMGSIGPYVNLLPLRFRNSNVSCNFEEVLRETRSKTYSVLANSKVPFQVLLNE